MKPIRQTDPCRVAHVSQITSHEFWRVTWTRQTSANCDTTLHSYDANVFLEVCGELLHLHQKSFYGFLLPQLVEVINKVLKMFENLFKKMFLWG